MTFETAIKCLEEILDSASENQYEKTVISFIGGEPLLEFSLLKSVVEYAKNRYDLQHVSFFATTNGTLLTDEMKLYFVENKDIIRLGLSLDGAKDTQDYNRSNSFDIIDLDFFRNTWKNPSVKMTLSEFSLTRLADDIQFLHTQGFVVHGANLANGNFDWDKDENIAILIPQLTKLVDFYVENCNLQPCAFFDKKLMNCEILYKKPKRICGIGVSSHFYDTDGSKYPCAYATPLSMSSEQLAKLTKIDFSDEKNFNDETCLNNCYLYPICGNCYGENFVLNGSMNVLNKNKIV